MAPLPFCFQEAAMAEKKETVSFKCLVPNIFTADGQMFFGETREVPAAEAEVLEAAQLRILESRSK